jgi:ATP-dependent DNA helicase 2 subunit 2
MKQTCLLDPGNKEFWVQVQKRGRGMSLISKPEAAKNGGISAIPESDAEEVS